MHGNPPVPEVPDREQRWVKVCAEDSKEVRLDKVLTQLFPETNRSQIQRALDNEQVRINGEIPKSRKLKLKAGDTVQVFIAKAESSPPKPVSIPLEVLFEDEDIVVVNKPRGMITHPGSGTGENTLVHALLAHCRGKLSRLNGEDRPGIIHRLDKDTSGVVIAAKSDRACTRLLKSFRERTVVKEYLAIVCGCPDPPAGTIDAPIARHTIHRTRMAVSNRGREAKTDYLVLASNGETTVLKCRIYTGRTHQIRVHLKHLGHPIVGDKTYGYRVNRHSNSGLAVQGPLLHAWRLQLQHPICGTPLEFTAEPPEIFQQWKLGIEDVD